MLRLSLSCLIVTRQGDSMYSFLIIALVIFGLLSANIYGAFANHFTYIISSNPSTSLISCNSYFPQFTDGKTGV